MLLASFRGSISVHPLKLWALYVCFNTGPGFASGSSVRRRRTSAQQHAAATLTSNWAPAAHPLQLRGLLQGLAQELKTCSRGEWCFVVVQLFLPLTFFSAGGAGVPPVSL